MILDCGLLEMPFEAVELGVCPSGLDMIDWGIIVTETEGKMLGGREDICKDIGRSALKLT